MTQRKFTFSKHFAKYYPKGYMPPNYLTVEDAFRASLLRQGYLIKSVAVTEVVQVQCVAARANIPRKEREKLQRELDNTHLTSNL